jgi:hypothetical protein
MTIDSLGRRISKTKGGLKKVAKARELLQKIMYENA